LIATSVLTKSIELSKFISKTFVFLNLALLKLSFPTELGQLQQRQTTL
jgi:hypothetical protein